MTVNRYELKIIFDSDADFMNYAVAEDLRIQILTSLNTFALNHSLKVSYVNDMGLFRKSGGDAE